MAIHFNQKLSGGSLWAYFHRKFENIGFFCFKFRSAQRSVLTADFVSFISNISVKNSTRFRTALFEVSILLMDKKLLYPLQTHSDETKLYTVYSNHFLAAKKKSARFDDTIKSYGRFKNSETRSVIKIQCLWAQNPSRYVQLIQLMNSALKTKKNSKPPGQPFVKNQRDTQPPAQLSKRFLRGKTETTGFCCFLCTRHVVSRKGTANGAAAGRLRPPPFFVPEHWVFGKTGRYAGFPFFFGST